MSGGHFNYSNDHAASEIFGWDCDVDYGLGNARYNRNLSAARKANPLNDKQLSELVFDVFCLLHSLDWCISGDTGEDDYNADVKFFKQKWLKPAGKDLVKTEINKAVDDLRNELMWSLFYNGSFDDEDGAE